MDRSQYSRVRRRYVGGLADGRWAADFKINPQAARFVLAILLIDSVRRRRAVAYMFSYGRMNRKLPAREGRAVALGSRSGWALEMDPSERQTLFKFYWAVRGAMPKHSTCFVRMEPESCRQESPNGCRVRQRPIRVFAGL